MPEEDSLPINFLIFTARCALLKSSLLFPFTLKDKFLTICLASSAVEESLPPFFSAFGANKSTMGPQMSQTKDKDFFARRLRSSDE